MIGIPIKQGNTSVPDLKDLQNGDQKAWQAFHSLHAVRLKHVALRFGVSEEIADDLVQEALIFFASRINEISDTNTGAFVAQKVRWLALSHLRKVKSLAEVPMECREDGADYSPEVVPASDSRVLAIREQLGQLSRTERLVLSLFYFNNCSYARIAEITGMNYDGVKNTLHRTKRRLKKQI